VAGEALRGRSVTAPAREQLSRPHARLNALRRDQRGTAVVEFALVAPLLFLILFGVLDFGRLLNYYNQQTQLVGLGARAAAVNRTPDDTQQATGTLIQQQLAETYAKGELNKKTNVCITLPNGSGIGQPVTVSASYQFNFLPLIGLAVGSPSITITASQTVRQEATPSYSTGCAS
jgi:Flp pilus assembly protein TadG